MLITQLYPIDPRPFDWSVATVHESAGIGQGHVVSVQRRLAMIRGLGVSHSRFGGLFKLSRCLQWVKTLLVVKDYYTSNSTSASDYLINYQTV